MGTRFIGYDWFKLIVAIILGILLIWIGLAGNPAPATTASSVPTTSAAVGLAVAAPTLKLPNAPVSAGALTLTGTGTPGSVVEVVVDGQSVGKANVGADGTWMLPITVTAGAHEVTLRGLDVAGATAATSNPVPLKVAAAGAPAATIAPTTAATIAATAPAAPTTAATAAATSAPTAAATAAATTAATVEATAVATTVAAVATPAPTTAGASQAPAIRSPADGAQIGTDPFTMTGIGTPGSQIEILDSDKVVGTVTVAADGTWSLPITPISGTASYGVRPVGSTDLIGTPIRVTVGAASAVCTSLGIGCNAWVTRKGGLPLRLRNGVGTSAAIIDRLPPGTQMTLLEGPQSANGYTWWRVRTRGNREGWLAGEELRLQPD